MQERNNFKVSQKQRQQLLFRWLTCIKHVRLKRSKKPVFHSRLNISQHDKDFQRILDAWSRRFSECGMAPWQLQVGCQPVRQGWRLHRTSWILMNFNTSIYFNEISWTICQLPKNQDKADRTEFYETQLYDKSTTCAFDRQLSQGLATETLATEDGRPIAVVKRETKPIAGMVFECGKRLILCMLSMLMVSLNI